MRRNITLAITLLVIALAALSLTKLADAQSIFLPAVSGGEGQTAEVTQSDVTPLDASPVATVALPIPTIRPVALTDLVPELGDEEKTEVVFQDEEGNRFGFSVAKGDNDKINELAKQYGPILAILEPDDRLYPGEKPMPRETPVYTGDPSFVHPKVEMPPYVPTQLPPPSELFKHLR